MSESFGSFLKSLRESSNLSQHQLALALGFSRTFLSNMENGREKPSANFLCRICAEFKLEPGDPRYDKLFSLARSCNPVPKVDKHAKYKKSMVRGKLVPVERARVVRMLAEKIDSLTMEQLSKILEILS